MLNNQIASLERKRNNEGYKTSQESMRIMRKQNNWWKNFRNNPEVISAMKKSNSVETDIGFMSCEEAVRRGARILFDPLNPNKNYK